VELIAAEPEEPGRGGEGGPPRGAVPVGVADESSGAPQLEQKLAVD
jgi:hypothetical protein